MAYYLDLFNGNPASGGTSVLSTITGSATRSNVTADLVESIHYAALLNTDTVTVADEAEANTNVSWVGLYDAPTGGTLLKRAPIGAHYTVAQGNPVRFLALNLRFTIAIAAPILTLDTPPTNNTPELTSAFADDAQAGDVITLQYVGSSGDWSAATTVQHTLDSSDILAGDYTFTVGPLTNGLWYFRSQVVRGGAIYSPWSNTVSERIMPLGSYVPTYYWLGF